MPKIMKNKYKTENFHLWEMCVPEVAKKVVLLEPFSLFDLHFNCFGRIDNRKQRLITDVLE
jgi:hypothetical protein